MINVITPPKISFIYNRRKTASPSRKAPVEMRICYDYQQKYLSTGIMLYPNQWKKGRIVNTPDIIQISKMLDDMLAVVRRILCDMMEKGSIDINDIQNRMKRLDSDKVTFLVFCRQRASIRKYGREKDTQKRYDRFIRLFEEWGGIDDFDDITEESIISYDKYLMDKGMKPYSKWNNYHRFLNTFIMDAIDAGYLKRNPYKWVNIEKDKSSRGLEKYLTPEEFHRLRTARMPTPCLERTRDLFIFQTYTCMSYTDLRDFDMGMVQEIRGAKVYAGSRNKTDKPFTIPILSPAWEILKKYNGKLPVINNALYNEYLKVIAQAAGIDKPLSTHWARHTGATMLLNEGVPMQIVSRICGHASTRITEKIYAKLLDETVVDAVMKNSSRPVTGREEMKDEKNIKTK